MVDIDFDQWIYRKVSTFYFSLVGCVLQQGRDFVALQSKSIACGCCPLPITKIQLYKNVLLMEGTLSAISTCPKSPGIIQFVFRLMD